MIGDDLGAGGLALMVLLGAYHGLNPAMGWLFAVALGMQEGKASAVGRSLVPIAIGHALAVGVVALVVVLVGAALPLAPIRVGVAAVLIGLGVYRLTRHRHPRWVRMQVGFRDLTAWSFLMASAHGAGLMVVPVLLGSHVVEAAAGHHHMSAGAGPAGWLIATGAHTIGYIAVTGIVATVVYQKVGLGILRKAWFNVDVLWAVALVVNGALTLLV
jgi:hypothetical protein